MSLYFSSVLQLQCVFLQARRIIKSYRCSCSRFKELLHGSLRDFYSSIFFPLVHNVILKMTEFFNRLFRIFLICGMPKNLIFLWRWLSTFCRFTQRCGFYCHLSIKSPDFYSRIWFGLLDVTSNLLTIFQTLPETFTFFLQFLILGCFSQTLTTDHDSNQANYPACVRSS